MENYNALNVTPTKPEVGQRHTEEIQDIIGTPPSWLLRWGITLFFSILIMILGLSKLIKYPDIIRTQLKIRSNILSQSVVVKTQGKLIKLFVQNNQEVNKYQTLALIETSNGNVVVTTGHAGKLTYTGILHEKQELSLNQTIFSISGNDQDFFGEMMIPKDGIGKVMEGQQVIVKLWNYPPEIYGMLHGEIKYITDNPSKEGEYIAEVDLKNKIVTDKNKKLPLKQGMIAEAEIIIQNVSLLQRVTKSILK